MKKWLAVILLLCGGVAYGQVPPGGYGPGIGSNGSSSGSSPSAQWHIIDATNPAQVTTTIKAPGRICQDGSWTNTQFTVNSTSCGAFNSSMVGWALIGSSSCALGGTQELTGTRTAYGTITTVNSTSQVTLTTIFGIGGANTGTVAAAGCFAIGPVEDTGLTALDTAVQAYPTCATGLMPGGVILFHTAHFIVQPTNCRPLGTDTSLFGQGEEIEGQAQGVTVLVPLMPLTGCTGAMDGKTCWNGVVGSFHHDYSMFGMNDSRNGDNTTVLGLFGLNCYAWMNNLFLAGVGNDATFGNILGVDANFTTAGPCSAKISNSTIDGFGGSMIDETGINSSIDMQSVIVQDMTTRGATFHTGGYANIQNSFFAGGIGTVANTVYLWCNGDGGTNHAEFVMQGNVFYPNGSTTVNTGIVNGANCTTYEENDRYASGFGAGSFAIGNNGVLHLARNNLNMGAGNTTITQTTGGSTFDEGGNTFNGTFVNTGGSFIVADGHSITAVCTGVATAASTIGLRITGSSLTGAAVVQACTNAAVVDSGVPMTAARTLMNLNVTSSAAGTNATSGVVTVLKNGGATALTCTIGTGTSCFDGTHQVTVVSGDLITITFTTQAAETLAGVKAFVEWQ
jgi:hypothetical protein